MTDGGLGMIIPELLMGASSIRQGEEEFDHIVAETLVIGSAVVAFSAIIEEFFGEFGKEIGIIEEGLMEKSGAAFRVTGAGHEDMGRGIADGAVIMEAGEIFVERLAEEVAEAETAELGFVAAVEPTAEEVFEIDSRGIAGFLEVCENFFGN